MLGTTQAKAESWLGQRKRIVQNLTELRGTINNLLSQLGENVERARRGRAGRRAEGSAVGTAAGAQSKPRRRKMSAKARKAISDAQKKRWAKLRADKE